MKLLTDLKIFFFSEEMKLKTENYSFSSTSRIDLKEMKRAKNRELEQLQKCFYSKKLKTVEKLLDTGKKDKSYLSYHRHHQKIKR